MKSISGGAARASSESISWDRAPTEPQPVVPASSVRTRSSSPIEIPSPAAGRAPARLDRLGQGRPADTDPALARLADEEPDCRFDLVRAEAAQEVGERGDLRRTGGRRRHPGRNVDHFRQEHAVILAAGRARIGTVRAHRMAVVLLPLLLAAGACGDDDKGNEDTKVTTETTTGGQKTQGSAATLKAALSGADEVPGPGASPGVGAALVTVTGTRICPELKVTMGEKPTVAHIHQGAKSASGPVVVDLKPEFTSGESAYESKTCVDVPADTVNQVLANPEGYYVNIHSDAHPNGALRGQLTKF